MQTPVSNLAVTMGIKSTSGIVPISQMKDLIKERTGASDEHGEILLPLNPTVSSFA